MRKFPYRQVGKNLRPTVDVALQGEAGVEFRTQALIDTGAPITVFDYAAGEALLVNYGRPDAVTGEIAILGARHRIQFEYIDLSLVADRTYSWTARIAFILNKSFVMDFQGMLGTDGFLDKWAVTFNKYHEYFVIQPPDEAPG